MANDLRWASFTIYYVRSLICICVSTLKNIYDSYNFDQLELIPPNDTRIEVFELALQEMQAFNYFAKFLERTDKTRIKTRLLQLYIDIRVYDELTRKLNKASMI